MTTSAETRQDFLDPARDLPPTRRGEYRYPVIELPNVRRCIVALEGEDAWDEKEYVRRLRRYRFLVMWPTLLLGFSLVLALLFIVNDSNVDFLNEATAEANRFSSRWPLWVQITSVMRLKFAI